MSLALIALLPWLGAALMLALPPRQRVAAAGVAGAVALAALGLLLTLAPALFAGELLHWRVEWLPQLGMALGFRLDGLAWLLALLITGIGALVVLYAAWYLAPEDSAPRFFAYLLLFMGAMLGVALADNLLLLVLFWELTSLSSFLLIGFWHQRQDARQGARMALTLTGAGGLCLLAGVLLIGHVVGSFDLDRVLAARELLQAHALFPVALGLVLLGAFTKSAQFPFHFWLPHAMAAPTPVSAFLHSATMVKAGLFLMARMWPVLAGTSEWFYLVATTGLVTMLVAAGIALFKDDLKGLLAYSTVSHLGLVTMLLGFGTPLAAVAAVFHILNHATFKAALFMNAGIVDHEAGTRDIKRLGGLLHLMPITATMAMVAGASMAGLPPFNGFLSKEMMLHEAVSTTWLGNGWVIAALATLAACFSVAYSFRYIAHVFFGARRDDYPHPPHDPPVGMWLPPALLVVLVVAIGLFPDTVAGPLVAVVARAVTGGALMDYHLALWHGFTPALGLSAIAVAVGLTALAAYVRVRAVWQAAPHPEAKAMFDGVIAAAVAMAAGITHRLHNGSLQRYLAFALTAVTVAGFVAFFNAPHAAGTRELLPAAPAAIVGWVLLVGGCALTVALFRRRVLSVLIVGTVGLIVCVAFIYLSAPDLALTQISVEVTTVILILLALYFLPKYGPQSSSVRADPLRHLRDGVLAVTAGLGMAGASWAMLTRDGTSLSHYYLENSVSGGGGTNVVNVILVDFRGFDTFGEITVLGIAALAIYALLDGALVGRVGRRLSAWSPDLPQSADRHPMIMVVATRVMLPLAMLVGAYIFLRGHNQPGGGFIAGLVVSIALVMQYMASGFGWAAHRVKVNYHAMIGAGVLVAAATGVAAMVLDQPFLTSTFGHFHLPLVGEFELASAMAFDTGVFLTVVGAVMLALANLSRMGRWTNPHSINKTAMDVDPSASLPKEHA